MKEELKMNENNANNINPAVWLSENPDLWSNKGSHIEFYCSLEEIPQTVLEAAKIYEQDQKECDKQMEILTRMGLNGQTESVPRIKENPGQ